jgi:hypothetical protein
MASTALSNASGAKIEGPAEKLCTLVMIPLEIRRKFRMIFVLIQYF